MSRKPPPFRPQTPQEHEQLLTRAARRCRAILESNAAQHPDALTMGTQIRFTAPHGPLEFLKTIDRESVAHAATLARAFTLASEDIHISRVKDSLLALDDGEQMKLLADQQVHLWNKPRKRMKVFVGKVDQDEPEVDGVWDNEVADRVLYAHVVHADDASKLLDHLGTDEQRWALATLTGDWIAYTANLEALIHTASPTACPQLTPWVGDPNSFAIRLTGRRGTPLPTRQADA